MRQQFVSATFEITPGMPDFHRTAFSLCTIILKGGDTAFLLCDFFECTFSPPYLIDGKVSPEWEDRMAGCSVIGSKTQTLLKKDEVAALAIPKLERPCRSDQRRTCYTPEKCVFDCTRSEP